MSGAEDGDSCVEWGMCLGKKLVLSEVVSEWGWG